MQKWSQSFPPVAMTRGRKAAATKLRDARYTTKGKKYNDNFKNRQLLPQAMFTPPDNLDNGSIVVQIKKRGWQRITQGMGPASIALVHEFYMNLKGNQIPMTYTCGVF